MKLLNLCCGSVRPQSEEWINIDNLHASLLPGTPERDNLDLEERYINMDVENDLFDYSRAHQSRFDGAILSHCAEHWDCQVAAKIMSECRFLLKPGGILIVSVPDASYFRRVHGEDTVENAERLFGEPIFLGDGETTFTGYGLWCPGRHKALISEDALWHYFVRAGFKPNSIHRYDPTDNRRLSEMPDSPLWKMIQLLNRLPFSLVMYGVKF